ncbi:MAG: sugar phosphate nucleotidyltransferase [Bowdeniella nasicola]|nr:sugar phosphate nucleotidyltransferase [Bowdeniella nasicola]
MTFVAIIPAGGAGTRLWPLSRHQRPKFLLDLTGSGKTLLQETVARLRPLVDHIVVVTGREHLAAVRAQVGTDLDLVIAEPAPRNSMPAIALAGELAARRWGEKVILGSFAADHTIGDHQAFANAVGAARKAATAGYVTTLGITPTYPATGFGYIAAGAPLGGDLPGAVVSQFTEKPPRAQAAAWVDAGGYFWNAGIFITSYRTLRGHLHTLQRQLARTIDTIATRWDEAPTSEIDALWEAIEPIAIDHAIAEPVATLGGVAVIPTAPQLGWDDLGDFTSLQPQTIGGATKRVVVSGGRPALIIDQRSHSAQEPPVVATCGIDDAIVVLTDDGYLITTRAHAQAVGELPAQLAARNLDEVT